MQIFYLILSLFFASGFYYFGNKVSKYLKLEEPINKISNPKYQYVPLGISYFIFISYPFFFFEIYNKFFFQIISIIFIIFGIFNIYINLNKFNYLIKTYFKKDKKFDYSHVLVIILLLLFFLLSISPVTSGDSISYHLGAAKYVFENGHFSKDIFSAEAAVVGSGEFLNAFAYSVKALQMTSLINFFGLISILGIIKKFSENNNLNKKNKNYLFLLILSCPVLVFLISSSKSQLFATSLIFFCYALLVYCLHNSVNKNFLNKVSFLLIILPIVSVQTKISFSVSFFIIVSTFFIFFLKKLNLKKFIFIFILCFIIGLIPHTLWKQIIYDYPFYNFIINPFPLNIPGYEEAYFDIRSYFQEKFPYILFLPLGLRDLTQFIGIGTIALYFLFITNYKNKKIILSMIVFFIFVYSFFGQKAARFYIEIYFFIILILTHIISRFKKNYIFYFFQKGIILQSIFVISISAYGVFTLLPGTFSEKLNKKILSNYASGYNLYNWANNVLPDESVTLIKHRSYYFAEKDIIYIGMTGFFKYESQNDKEFYIKKIKEKEPNYIIFYGNEERFNYDNFNFRDCIKKLFKKKNKVGFHETRSPFTSDKKYYNGYIYHIDSTKMPGCVKF